MNVHSKAEFRRNEGAISEKHLVRAFTERVWRQYLFDYERYLLEKAQRTAQPQNAIIYFDSNPGQEKHIRRIVREFARRFDQQGSFPNAGIVEDVVFRDSKTSYLIQLADILAFSMYRISSRRSAEDSIMTKDMKDRLVRKIQERHGSEMV